VQKERRVLGTSPKTAFTMNTVDSTLLRAGTKYTRETKKNPGSPRTRREDSPVCWFFHRYFRFFLAERALLLSTRKFLSENHLSS
jgi:hypothetical protein